ncbi:response regulator transcription factor [Spirosoma sp. BT702]|uniref:Response regulator transcription factor n=1 Tax=Spirosoma profusum TaxID=2771354 RepID=A0A926Y2N6_9BACT|nr:response regulator transcription factor [Spirosoma profusum]MBD2700986.1 response regulator transcription factor [Spirosoma profusum]
MSTTIAVVDDHRLVAQAFSGLIQTFNDYDVLFVAGNGREVITYLEQKQIPDIILLDLHMPEMDGFETALYLQEHYPDVKIIVLSMFDREEDITRMLRLGVRSYLLKACLPSELRLALDDVCTKGHHYSELLAKKLFQNFTAGKSKPNGAIAQVNDRELKFLKLASSDLTYAEIADIMCVALRTVDGYRESLFQKLNVKSRTGMVLEALRLGLTDLRDLGRR